MGMDELDIYHKQGFGNQSGFGDRKLKITELSGGSTLTVPLGAV